MTTRTHNTDGENAVQIAESNSAPPELNPSPNENHKRRLLITCQYIDKLLADIESTISASSSKSPFPKYLPDISLAQARVTQDYIRRIRAQMLRVLEGQRVQIPRPRIGSVHSIRTALDFIDIAVEELRPRYMRGYGEVPEALIPELDGIAAELGGLAQKLNAYLAQGQGQDLDQRLARLEKTEAEVELLKVLERIVGDHGLIEFRADLARILGRLEEKKFEIAVFGRVSSGKSSLLNSILQSRILPVGVNPITAVPTRIAYGPSPRVIVSFADRPAQNRSIDELAEFATEERNPANSKHVTRIAVEAPAPHLENGVVFVDTPGLGSLATSGAAETMAYLPRCDLGIVLIDAGSSLSPDDLSTIQALYEAAIPAQVLLSKADLLALEDRAGAAEYIENQISAHLSLHLRVHCVSTLEGQTHLLDHWFSAEISPLFERQQELARQSVRRKAGLLRESVETSLRMELERSSRKTGQREQSPARDLEKDLRRASGRFEETRIFCERAAEEIGSLSDEFLARASAEIVEAPGAIGEAAVSDSLRPRLALLASERSRLLIERLQDLSGNLSHGLAMTAKSLKLNNAPGAEELSTGLREMPQLDLGALPGRINMAVPRVMGKRIAEYWLKRRLKRDAEPALQAALASYSRLLDAWSRAALEEMHARFSAYADVYRAQLERLDVAHEASREQHELMRRDLEELRRFRPDERRTPSWKTSG